MRYTFGIIGCCSVPLEDDVWRRIDDVEDDGMFFGLSLWSTSSIDWEDSKAIQKLQITLPYSATKDFEYKANSMDDKHLKTFALKKVTKINDSGRS